MNPSNRLAISISGSGGSGAVTTGNILLTAMAKAGFYGVMSRSAGPQIRGGESAVMLHFSDQMLEVMPDSFDIHFSLDWRNFERFSDEIPLNQDSLVLFDDSRDKLPGLVFDSGATVQAFTFNPILKTIENGKANMLALGVLASVIGLSTDTLKHALKKVLGRKGDLVLQDSMAAIQQGLALVPTGNLLQDWQSRFQPKWLLSGNEAIGFGALQGGVRFAAAYPITPATEIVEYLAPRLDKVGGSLLIAEDELAAINMVIGSSFGGVPSMTATSGPGFSLMTEGMGLAVASETPVLVVNVMRGGPSTGIPTKSEQTDLNQVLYGLHGEAPHIVVAPLSIRDSVVTSQWATGLAEALQTLVVEVSDQRIGQSRAILDPVKLKDLQLTRQVAHTSASHYQRYAPTSSGISPMGIPGEPELLYTADGLEHTPSGLPSSMAIDHQQQLEKRAHKLNQFDYGGLWAEVESAEESEGENKDQTKVLIITWGSSFSVCQQAVKELNKTGISTELLGLRLLMPLNIDKIREMCQEKTVLVVEQSYSGQFYRYLLSDKAIPQSALSFAQPGPLMIKSNDIISQVKGALS